MLRCLLSKVSMSVVLQSPGSCFCRVHVSVAESMSGFLLCPCQRVYRFRDGVTAESMSVILHISHFCRDPVIVSAKSPSVFLQSPCQCSCRVQDRVFFRRTSAFLRLSAVWCIVVHVCACIYVLQSSQCLCFYDVCMCACLWRWELRLEWNIK